MSILAKYNAAMEAKDEAAMNEILHDDYNQEILWAIKQYKFIINKASYE